MSKSLFLRSAIAGFMAGIVICGAITPQTVVAQDKEINLKFCKEPFYVVKTVKWVVTAYSSAPDETDDAPEIAASGQKVFDGMIANNGLPFGTRIRMSEIFGDKILIVGDRMHQRKGKAHGDVWMSSKEEANRFGARWNVKVEILES